MITKLTDQEKTKFMEYGLPYFCETQQDVIDFMGAKIQGTTILVPQDNGGIKKFKELETAFLSGKSPSINSMNQSQISFSADGRRLY